jgi:hypothetical protein
MFEVIPLFLTAATSCSELLKTLVKMNKIFYLASAVPLAINR